MRLLFVCSGNICRSAMADAICRREARRRGLDELDVRSAGTLGIVGAPASPEAIQALGEIDVDLTGHRSSALTRELIGEADLVIVMDRGHERALRSLDPDALPRTRRLLAFEEGPDPASPGEELADPVGAPLPVFRRQRSRIVASVGHLLDGLVAGGGVDDAR